MGQLGMKVTLQMEVNLIYLKPPVWTKGRRKRDTWLFLGLVLDRPPVFLPGWPR